MTFKNDFFGCAVEATPLEAIDNPKTGEKA